MADIYDDVEKMLAAENEAASEKTTGEAEVFAEDELDAAEMSATSDEGESFNESELEDIMAEIESLESDFENIQTDTPVIAATPKEVLKVEAVDIAKTDLQKEIEKEIAMIDAAMIDATTDDTFEDSIDSAIDEMDSVVDTSASSDVGSVLSFEKKTYAETPVTPKSSSKSEMSFAATGMMNLNLSFKVGSEEAKLYIDEVKGLVITLSGVEVCLNEMSGCSVTMENGINFNIPLNNSLTSKENGSKKKAA